MNSERGNIRYSFVNYFKFLAFIMPHVIVFFFILQSIFSQNLKVIFYLAGLLFMNIALNVIKSSVPIIDGHPVCTIFNSGLEFIDIPSNSVSTLAYTMMYLLFPMVFFNVINIGAITSMILLISFVIYFQMEYKCITGMGAFLGISIGVLVGLLMALFTASVNRDYLYFSEYISDKVACSVPDKQTFRCNVYKGQELIGQF